jgi:hypothetical protein
MDNQGQLSLADIIKNQYLKNFGGESVSLSSLLLPWGCVSVVLFIYFT